MTGRTDEGQSRRIVWEVCPVKRPLPSVAKITKAGNQVYLGEDQGLCQEQQDRANHEPPSRAQRVDACLVGKVEFSEAGPLRTCAGTNVTTMGPVLVRPLLAPVDEESAPMEDGEGGEDESMQGRGRGREKTLFMKSENQPSSKEVQEHMKTHIPYRS